MNESLQILPSGGRIKSAYIGMNQLLNTNEQLHRDLQALRKNPTPKFQEAFFPNNLGYIKQVMGDLGIYRATIKNDQGMPGQFIPFGISNNNETNFENRIVVANEGIAIPEMNTDHSQSVIEQVQRSFLDFNYGNVLDDLFENYSQIKKESGKGRNPYFFIRPGSVDKEMIFGQEAVEKVNHAVRSAIESIDIQTRF
jgi:hypothetical protein